MQSKPSQSLSQPEIRTSPDTSPSPTSLGTSRTRLTVKTFVDYESKKEEAMKGCCYS